MSEKIRCKVTDTKQEILRLYKTHLDDINAKASLVPSSTAEVAKVEKVTKAVETASIIQAVAVEDLAIQLNRSISDSLMGITKQINEQKATFDQLTVAIQAKKDELRKVHQIEVDLNALAAIIAAQNKAKEETNVEIDEIIAKAENEAESIIKAAEDHSKSVELQIATFQAEENKRRTRDAEQYNYEFERNKKERINKLNDELAILSKSLDVREAAMRVREETIKDLDAKIVNLTNEIITLKANQEKAIADAVSKATKSAETGAAVSASIVKSKHDAELAIKDNLLSSAISQANELRVRIDTTNAALAAAQKQVQEVAMQALQAKAEASRPLVVNGNESSNKR